jgi:hypothetical protein
MTLHVWEIEPLETDGVEHLVYRGRFLYGESYLARGSKAAPVIAYADADGKVCEIPAAVARVKERE